MLLKMFGWTSKVVPGRERVAEEPAESSNSSDEINLVGDQFPNMKDQRANLQWWDFWILGISTAIGGHFYLWNACFLAGLGNFAIAYFLIASAYGMLALCIAELSSALPFAGGAYGISRVTLGTLPGFLIGCFDAYQSMFNVMYSNIAMGVMISVVAEIDRKWEPLWWFIIYSSYMIIHIIGGPWMWRVLRTLSLGSLGILLIYILGSIKYAEFNEYAPLSYPPGLTGKDQYFQGGIDLFLKIIPIPCWFFVGMESINLASHDAVNPKRDVPRGYIAAYLTILCTSTACIFIGASLAPGSTWLPYYINPTSLGYMRIFDIDYRKATCLSLPAIYTSGFGFTYYYGSQVRAMGKSGLANTWLGYDVPGFKTPVVALLFGFVVGYLVGLRYYFFEVLPQEDLFSISLLGSVATYCSQFISFIVFRLHYSSIKREFTSPLGIAGAVYGLLVFLLMFIVIAGFEKNPAIIIFAVYVGVLVIYYYLVVRKRQLFSEEEKTVLFKAYLIKTNQTRNARLRSGQNRSQKLYAAPVPTTAATAVAQEVDQLALPSQRLKPTPSNAGSDDPSLSTRSYPQLSRGAEAYLPSESRSEEDERTVRLSVGNVLQDQPSIPEEDAARSSSSPVGADETGDGSAPREKRANLCVTEASREGTGIGIELAPARVTHDSTLAAAIPLRAPTVDF